MSNKKDQSIERYYIFLGHLFHPILWLAPMSPQQIRCKGKESKNENDISAVCLLKKYLFSPGWFWLMKKRVLQIGRFVLVPQKLRPLGFFANIKNPATSWPKEINRSLFAKTEKPPGASSNSGLKRDQPYLGPLGCLAKSLRVKQRRMVSKERPSERPTFLSICNSYSWCWPFVCDDHTL